MKASLKKYINSSLIGSISLTMSLFGIPQMARAVDMIKGFDYFQTFGDGASAIVLPSIGIVPLIGTPFDPVTSIADTKLERLEDCTFINDSCTVPLLIHELNLQSTTTVDLSPYGLSPSVVLIRLLGTQQPGFITINQSTKTWTADLPITAYAELPDDTTLVIPGYGPLIFYATANQGELLGSGTYTTLDKFDAKGLFTGPLINDISLSAPHPQEMHAMTPIALGAASVPEPSPVISLTLLGLLGVWKSKKSS